MAWLKLLRIANLPTAISNVLVGYLLANGSWATRRRSYGC